MISKRAAKDGTLSTKTSGARFALASAAILIAHPALAHSGTGLPGGFIAGLEHPLSGPDHMLAMVSVGLWGAFLGRPLIVALPVIFPMLMTIGAGAGMLGLRVPPVEIGIAMSMVVLGALILFAVRAPIWIACLIVGIFGFFHGYAHGVELPSAADPIGYAAGFVLTTGLLHVSGIALGLLRSRPGGDALVRTLGAGVVVGGIWFLKAAVV